jgi:serine/threonine-protein kinase
MESQKRHPKNLGAYEILSVLGEGANAIVYLGRDKLGRKVALKVERNSQPEDENARERFKREARIALTLDHPNIVKTYDAGVVEGCVYIASEVLGGGTLAEVLDRETRLSENATLYLARDLLRALRAIEHAGLIHRDVKPENVIFTQIGVAKLGDLGLARPTALGRTPYTGTGTILGSPLYMSPEQIEEVLDLDVRSDLYSLGCVVYHCLVGEPPFQGRSVLAVLKKHLNEPLPDLRRKAPGLSAPVREIVESLLEKDRTKRPATPDVVLGKIERLVKRPGTGGAKTTAGRIAVPEGLIESELAPVSDPGGVRPPLARVALVAESPEGPRTLFLYSGEDLRFGRVWLEDDPAHVCLRLRPEGGNEVANQKISRRHFAVSLRGGRPTVTDLGSVGGTILANDGLPKDQAVAIPRPRVQLSIARVLDLIVRVVDPPGTAPAEEGTSA